MFLFVLQILSHTKELAQKVSNCVKTPVRQLWHTSLPTELQQSVNKLMT